MRTKTFTFVLNSDLRQRALKLIDGVRYKSLAQIVNISLENWLEIAEVKKCK